MSTFRITTNGMFRNYRSHLYKNNVKLNNAMTSVQTQRVFNTYAEDPASASRAWRLRRAYWRTGDQIDNNNYAISKFESAYSAMAAIVDGDSEHPGLDGLIASIEGVSDTSGAARVALGRQLMSTSESIVSMMNSKYGDDYIFAGADGANMPFEWDGDKLLYRGIDVNLEKPSLPASFGFTDSVMEEYGLTSKTLASYDASAGKLDIEDAAIEKPLTLEEFKESAYYDANSADSEDVQYQDYKTAYVDRNKNSGDGIIKLKETDVDDAFKEATGLYNKLSTFQAYAMTYTATNGVSSYAEGVKQYEKLESMANEATYLDIGLGLKEDETGEFVLGSAFNSAISGLDFLGFGKDQNLGVLVRELGNIFLSADPETGNFTSQEDENRASELLDLIHNSVRSAQGRHVQLSADANYLKTNIQQLETSKYQLNEQIMDTESMDAAEAITEMTWAQYCYNAALRIGTNLLSQSLIDYMS
ncbi:MAG: hypothetical protein J5449_05260 [Oscillospiraceae bacterium]|nr:hypothetical protein [Oscillospiraceae bacterium]